jgi:hypothetical protein
MTVRLNQIICSFPVDFVMVGSIRGFSQYQQAESPRRRHSHRLQQHPEVRAPARDEERGSQGAEEGVPVEQVDHVQRWVSGRVGIEALDSRSNRSPIKKRNTELITLSLR